MLDSLKEKSHCLGKPNWRKLIHHLTDLHEKSLHTPFFPLSYQWEVIAAGEGDSMIFGHWDTVHIALDTLASEPQHSLSQILNITALQREDGFIPGYVWREENTLRWRTQISCPPLWPVAVEDHYELKKDLSVLKRFLPILEKQIEWFEKNRRSQPEGYYYLDCLDRFWESGVEEGVRFNFGDEGVDPEDVVSIDATSHLYQLYFLAAQWRERIGVDFQKQKKRAEEIQAFIQNRLFDDEVALFLDKWMIDEKSRRVLTFEGFWPLIVGVASAEQAERVVNENILNPKRFFSDHPITTVSRDEPCFEKRLWCGPVRNSVTYWVARGCERYGWRKGAKELLEKALDATALQLDLTGEIWEFYDPDGGSAQSLVRDRENGTAPYKDYLGHNPLIAMVEMWERLKERG